MKEEKKDDASIPTVGAEQDPPKFQIARKPELRRHKQAERKVLQLDLRLTEWGKK